MEDPPRMEQPHRDSNPGPLQPGTQGSGVTPRHHIFIDIFTVHLLILVLIIFTTIHWQFIDMPSPRQFYIKTIFNKH